jgi:hypothetical protein
MQDQQQSQPTIITISIAQDQRLHFSTRKKNRLLTIISKGKWTDQQLEDAIDIVESGHTSLRKANKYQNIIFTSLLDHLNGTTKSRKMGLQGLLT